MNAQQAIDESISTHSIVTLDDADADTIRALLCESDDSVENGPMYEFWGRNEDGATWRVHVARRTGAASDWQPTHEIHLDSGEVIPVMLHEGAAYTRAEWDATISADYECSEDGSWTFLGQPFAGRIVRTGAPRA